MVQSLKYFLFYYMMMGLLPILFNKLNLNSKQSGVLTTKSILFQHTIFSDPNDKNEAENLSSLLVLDKNTDQEDNRGSNLYRKSLIVKDLKIQEGDNKLEFMAPEDTNRDIETNQENL